MDYHGWMILEKSLGILEYGEDFNRALANPSKPGKMRVFARKLWDGFKSRVSKEERDFDMQTAQQNKNNCCQA